MCLPYRWLCGKTGCAFCGCFDCVICPELVAVLPPLFSPAIPPQLPSVPSRLLPTYITGQQIHDTYFPHFLSKKLLVSLRHCAYVIKRLHTCMLNDLQKHMTGHLCRVLSDIKCRKTEAYNWLQKLPNSAK